MHSQWPFLKNFFLHATIKKTSYPPDKVLKYILKNGFQSLGDAGQCVPKQFRVDV